MSRPQNRVTLAVRQTAPAAARVSAQARNNPQSLSVGHCGPIRCSRVVTAMLSSRMANDPYRPWCRLVSGIVASPILASDLTIWTRLSGPDSLRHIHLFLFPAMTGSGGRSTHSLLASPKERGKRSKRGRVSGYASGLLRSEAISFQSWMRLFWWPCGSHWLCRLGSIESFCLEIQQDCRLDLVTFLQFYTSTILCYIYSSSLSVDSLSLIFPLPRSFRIAFLS